MIRTRLMHPSGAWEVYALVRDTRTYEVFLHSESYYGYDKTEARKAFVISMTQNHLVLVND